MLEPNHARKPQLYPARPTVWGSLSGLTGGELARWTAGNPGKNSRNLRPYPTALLNYKSQINQEWLLTNSPAVYVEAVSRERPTPERHMEQQRPGRSSRAPGWLRQTHLTRGRGPASRKKLGSRGEGDRIHGVAMRLSQVTGGQPGLKVGRVCLRRARQPLV